MRSLFTIALLFSGFFLSGCLAIIETVNAIDSKIERKVRSDTGEYLVNLSLNGKEEESTRFRLEEYYDAQPSLRGNFWSWRMVGETHSSRVKILAADEKLGEVAFILMSTEYLRKESISDFRAFFVEVGGTTYWPSKDENDRDTFLAYDKRGNVTGSINLSYRIDIEFIPDAPT